jgi:hypothetical protein
MTRICVIAFPKNQKHKGVEAPIGHEVHLCDGSVLFVRNAVWKAMVSLRKDFIEFLR